MKKFFYFSLMIVAAMFFSCKKTAAPESNADSIKIDTAAYKNLVDSATSMAPTTEEESTDDQATTEEETSTDESEEGTGDYEEFLSSYKEYVDDYISFMKKAAKGDPTAIAELAGYMQKAQEYQSKLEDAKGEMSAAQWAEFNKINAKFIKAMSEAGE